MGLLFVSLVLLAVLFILLGSSLWIGFSLLLAGLTGISMFMDVPALTIMANTIWNHTNGSALMALPLFIFMGEILFRSTISENLFKGLAPWMDSIPGSLMHVNIFASALFAAVSGSSAATTATVGKITLPEFAKRDYNRKLSVGSIAGAGTLGLLIPPSMVMLIYGIMADVSIGKLFIAGIIPGVLIALVFSGFIMLRALKNPLIAPKSQSRYSWDEKLRSIPLLLPVICLIGTVLGSIYTGWATPTEAAAVGSLASLVFAFVSKSMTLKGFKEALMGAVRTNAMVMLIMVGASYLSVVVGYLGITRGLSQYVSGLGLSPYLLIVILSIMYLGLGCLVDGFSMIVMTTPITLPLVQLAGFDPIWFGIFLVIMIEVAQITPPLGFNLFVLKGMTGMSITEVALATMPFFLLLVSVAGVITVFPQIVLYLPNLMIQ